MKRIDQKYDVLFSSVDFADGEMARELLAERGIPSMLHSHGVDADATVGVGSIYHQLLVPLGGRDEARRILEEVWGAAAVEKIEPSRQDPGPFPAESSAGEQP
jgi:hypothetical protein